MASWAIFLPSRRIREDASFGRILDIGAEDAVDMERMDDAKPGAGVEAQNSPLS